MTARAGLVAVALLACRPGPGAPAQDPPTSPDDDATCGPVGTVFADLAWVPDDAPLCVLLDLAAPDLAAAADGLARVIAADGSDVPIRVGADLRALGFESTSLRGVLADLGVQPAQLAKLHDAQGRTVFVVPHACDLSRVRERARTRFSLRAREAVGGWILAPPDGAFSFDVLLLRGDRLALAPRGAGAGVLAWLDGASAATTDPASAAPRSGRAVAELPPAPIRASWQGNALVLGQAATRGGVHVVRATADAVEIDGSLRTVP